MFKRSGARALFGRRLAVEEDDDDDDEEGGEGEGGGLDSLYARGGRERKKRKSAKNQVPRLTLRARADSIESLRVDREDRLREIKRLPGLLIEDIANGMEVLPIPAINEVDEDPFPSDIEYIVDYKWASHVKDLVDPILKKAELDHLRFRGDAKCGLIFNRILVQRDAKLDDIKDKDFKRTVVESYTKDGRLMGTDPFGIHECDDSCTSKKCLLNKQVTGGIRLPLEVFKVGYGS